MVKKEKLRKTVKKKAIQRSLMNLMMDQVQSLQPDPIAKNLKQNIFQEMVLNQLKRKVRKRDLKVKTNKSPSKDQKRKEKEGVKATK